MATKESEFGGDGSDRAGADSQVDELRKMYRTDPQDDGSGSGS